MDDQQFTTLSAGGMQPESRSPSESPSDDISIVQPESSPASSVSATTHDTSRTKYHIDELSTFAQRLEEAATKVFPNKGRSRYKDVQVLLLRWEQDTMGVEYELDDLADSFAKDFGFKTETWLIPTAQPHLALMGKAFKMVQDFGEKDNLLIVYYAGHGGMNSSRQPLWSCTGDLNSPYLQWYAIQTIFEQAEADVLLLLDCCAAASSAPADGQCNSVTETIAACGFETWAPQPGRHSFTNTLIAVLDDWLDRASFTAAMLHCEILNRLRHEKPERRRNIKNFECRRTPVHILSTIDARAGSVEISRRHIPEHVPTPTSRNGKEPETADAHSAMDIDSVHASAVAEDMNQPGDIYAPDSVNKVLATGETALPQVLISLALEEEQLLDLEECRKWLQQFPALAKYAKVQGIFKSNSTLILLSLPVLIWDWLPDDMACSFIAYVHSTNLLSKVPTEPEPVAEMMGQRFSQPQYVEPPPNLQAKEDALVELGNSKHKSLDLQAMKYVSENRWHSPDSQSKQALGPKIWTQFLPRLVRQAAVPGEGLCYFYEDGSHCKAVIDGEVVNAHWGVTKSEKPRKRLAIACITCRERNIKCDPDYPRCVQCKKYGTICKFKNASTLEPQHGTVVHRRRAPPSSGATLSTSESAFGSQSSSSTTGRDNSGIYAPISTTFTVPDDDGGNISPYHNAYDIDSKRHNFYFDPLPQKSPSQPHLPQASNFSPDSTSIINASSKSLTSEKEPEPFTFRNMFVYQKVNSAGYITLKKERYDSSL